MNPWIGAAAIGLLPAACASSMAGGPSATAALEPTRGNATPTAELDVVTIDGVGRTDIVGRSVIVHEDPDDSKTQPTGNPGVRVAGGVIRKP